MSGLCVLLGCSGASRPMPDTNEVSVGGVGALAPSPVSSAGMDLGGSGGMNVSNAAGMSAGGSAGMSAGGSAGGNARGLGTGGIVTGAAGVASDRGAGGTGNAGASAGATAESAQAPTWDNVKLVLTGTHPACNSSICHGGNGKVSLGFPVTNDAQLYAVLTQYVSKDCGNEVLVSPGHPEASALVKVLKGPCSDKVPRMPNGCTAQDENCVPDDYIAAVEQWIADGANRP